MGRACERPLDVWTQERRIVLAPGELEARVLLRKAAEARRLSLCLPVLQAASAKAKSNVSFTAQPGVHYKMGTRIAQAFPVV